MTGPVIIGGGLLLIFLGGFSYIAGKPLPEKEWTPFEKANYISGKIILVAGAVCVVAGLLWTIKEMLS